MQIPPRFGEARFRFTKSESFSIRSLELGGRGFLDFFAISVMLKE
jgi:hypothetical protein